MGCDASRPADLIRVQVHHALLQVGNGFVKSTCELDFFPPKFDFLNELVFLAFVNEVLLCTDELVFVLLLVLLLLLLLLLFDDLLGR